MRIKLKHNISESGSERIGNEIRWLEFVCIRQVQSSFLSQRSVQIKGFGWQDESWIKTDKEIIKDIYGI